nr:MAG TPA: hypothetical protein [Caudoviricetes sp.]
MNTSLIRGAIDLAPLFYCHYGPGISIYNYFIILLEKHNYF